MDASARDFFDKLAAMERSILFRLGEQDVRMARMEEGQKALNTRIDNHIAMEEKELMSKFEDIHRDVRGLRDSVQRIAGAEAANTGWRLYLTKIWKSGSGFLKWVGFATILGLGGYAIQASGLVG